MKIKIQPYFLEFIHPFVLAHGTRKGTQLAFVKIEFGGVVAFGEASLPPYRKETVASVSNWVEKQQEKVLFLLSTCNPFENQHEIPFSKENPAASAALQTAMLNWYLKKENKQLVNYFEQTNFFPNLTLTLTKSDFSFLDEKLLLATHFTHLKLKLTGADDDVEFVKAIRKKTNLPFCIDLNQGCKNQEKAIQLMPELEKLNCVLVEQPLSDINHEGHYWLKKRTPLPIIADESICFYEDLIQLHEAYSGVNIKLMKCGGLFQAQKMLNFINNDKAISTNFMRLLGCMSESSLGVATASVLASQCVMADLDAPYLNKNNPFEGFKISNKKIEIAIDVEPSCLFFN